MLSLIQALVGQREQRLAQGTGLFPVYFTYAGTAYGKGKGNGLSIVKYDTFSHGISKGYNASAEFLITVCEGRDDELVTAVAGDEAVMSGIKVLEPELAAASEHFIAYGVTVPVIDILEVVHIYQGNAELLTAAAGFKNIVVEMGVHIVAAVAVCEGISQKAGIFLLQASYFVTRVCLIAEP